MCWCMCCQHTITNLSKTSHLNPFPNSRVVDWYLCGTFVGSFVAYYHHMHQLLAPIPVTYNLHLPYYVRLLHRPPSVCDASSIEILHRSYCIWLRYVALMCNQLPVLGIRVTWHHFCFPSEMDKIESINFIKN